MRAYTRRSSTKQRLAREPEGGFVIANQTILEPLDDDLARLAKTLACQIQKWAPNEGLKKA